LRGYLYDPCFKEDGEWLIHLPVGLIRHVDNGVKMKRLKSLFSSEFEKKDMKQLRRL